MKVKVLKAFSDGKKKCTYKENQTIDVAKERYGEINSTSNGLLVEEIKAKNEPPKEG